MRGIEYLFLRFGLFLIFFAVGSPVVVILVWLYDYTREIEWFRWVLVPLVILYFFAVPWLANRTAQQMVFENQKFGVAVKIIFYEVWLSLAFLPLVGHWFERKTDKRKTEDDATE